MITISHDKNIKKLYLILKNKICETDFLRNFTRFNVV
jgi:hypothetical protein